MAGHKCCLVITFAIFCLFFIGTQAHSCTTFVIGDRDRQLFGRNYDFGFGDGYVMVNKRGVAKTAYPSISNDETGEVASWASQFGSVTFNQFGREFPQGGMNEAGLIIESMALRSTRYPQPDSRPYIRSPSLWRQYILDTCSTVKEVIDNDSQIRISYDASKGIGTHFLVLDRTGDAAIIEFIDGKMVVHTGDSLPIRVLTNNTYEDSLYYWQKKSSPLIDRWSSIQRFLTAATSVQACLSARRHSNPDFAFGILAAVSGWQTRWSIVYDNQNMRIYFRTDGNPGIREIDMKALDFSCRTPVKVLDLNNELTGDVTDKLIDYTPEMNINLTKVSFTKLGSMINIPPQIVEIWGTFPDGLKCGE